MSGPTYTRRQAYAQFLLFGDPVSLRPSPVGLVDMLIIDLEDLAELARWKRAFLGDNLSHEGLLDDAEPGQLIAYADGTWAGWPLRFTVHAPERQDDVDELAADATRSKLQQLVDEAGRFMDTGQFPGEDPEEHSVICDGPDCTGECCEDES